MGTITAQTTQVYSLFIKATPEQVWDAITKPEHTQKYFFKSRVTVTPQEYRAVGGDGTELVVGTVDEYDPPSRLVHGWRALYDPAAAAEPESRVMWEIEAQAQDGVTGLWVVHDRLDEAPKTAEGVAGRWMFVLSGLKTLLETGQPLVS